MDSLNASDASQLEKASKCTQVIHKRRSSIFQTRAISFDACKENEKSIVPQEESFSLEEYIVSLKNERKEWIETVKQRKAQRRSLAKQKLCMESQGQAVDLNVLTESERAFITARPNYQRICKNYKEMSNVALKVSELHNIVYKLNKKFILRMEEGLCRLTDKIIETAD